MVLYVTEQQFNFLSELRQLLEKYDTISMRVSEVNQDEFDLDFYEQ